jgi:hypothetical protein
MVCCCREGRNSWTQTSLLLTHRSPGFKNPFYFIPAGDFAPSSGIIIGTTEPITISGYFLTGYTDDSENPFLGVRSVAAAEFCATMPKATVLEQKA